MILPTFRRQGLEEQRPYLFGSAIFHALGLADTAIAKCAVSFMKLMK